MSKGPVGVSYTFTNLKADDVSRVFEAPNANVRVDFSGNQLDTLDNQEWLRKAIASCFTSKNAKIDEDEISFVFKGANGFKYKITSNENNQVTVEYLVSADAKWQPGLPNQRVRTDFIKSLGLAAAEAKEQFEISVAKSDSVAAKRKSEMSDAFEIATLNEEVRAAFLIDPSVESTNIRSDIADKYQDFVKDRNFKNLEPLIVDAFDRRNSNNGHVLYQTLPQKVADDFSSKASDLILRANSDEISQEDALQEGLELFSRLRQTRRSLAEKENSLAPQASFFGSAGQDFKNFMMAKEGDKERSVAMVAKLTNSNKIASPRGNLAPAVGMLQHELHEVGGMEYSLESLSEGAEAIQSEINSFFVTNNFTANREKSLEENLREAIVSGKLAAEELAKAKELQQKARELTEAFAYVGPRVAQLYLTEIEKAGKQKSESVNRDYAEPADAVKIQSKQQKSNERVAKEGPYASVDDVTAVVEDTYASIDDGLDLTPEAKTLRPSSASDTKMKQSQQGHQITRPSSAPADVRRAVAANEQNRSRFSGLRRAFSGLLARFSRSNSPRIEESREPKSDVILPHIATNLANLVAALKSAKLAEGALRKSLPADLNGMPEQMLTQEVDVTSIKTSTGEDTSVVLGALIKKLVGQMSPPIIPVDLQKEIRQIFDNFNSEKIGKEELKKEISKSMGKMPKENLDALKNVLDGALHVEAGKAVTKMDFKNLGIVLGTNLFRGLEDGLQPAELPSVVGTQNNLAQLLLEMNYNNEILQDKAPSTSVAVFEASLAFDLDRVVQLAEQAQSEFDAQSETDETRSVDSGIGSSSRESSPASSPNVSRRANTDDVPSGSVAAREGGNKKGGLMSKLFGGRRTARVEAAPLQNQQKRGMSVGGN